MADVTSGADGHNQKSPHRLCEGEMKGARLVFDTAALHSLRSASALRSAPENQRAGIGVVRFRGAELLAKKRTDVQDSGREPVGAE